MSEDRYACANPMPRKGARSPDGCRGLREPTTD